MQKVYENGHYTGERALFRLENATIRNALFDDGESPLKEGRNLTVENVTFGYKYPLWYGKGHTVRNSTFLKMSRSGIWYTDDSTFRHLDIIAPKEFRRCRNITLEDIVFHDAKETLWQCDGVKMKNVSAKGDYFGMNSKNLKIDHFTLDGNYCFDGGENILIRNSVLRSKDAFWNCKHVTLINCTIIGEYFSWNSENIHLIDCKVSSHQGFCYMKNVRMEHSSISAESDLIFEYCEDLSIDVRESDLLSIKNPISGEIHARFVKEVIRDDERIAKGKVHIFVQKGEEEHEI